MSEPREDREATGRGVSTTFVHRGIAVAAVSLLLAIGSCAVVVAGRGAGSTNGPAPSDEVAGITVVPSTSPSPSVSPTPSPTVSPSPDDDEEATEVPELPDLLVSSLTRDAVVVVNAGAASAGGFSLSVSGTSFSVSGLPSGASATRPFECRGGTLTATVDPSDAIAESNERNNERTAGPFDCEVAEGPQPDLVVTNLTSTRIAIANRGDAASGAFAVGVSGSAFAFSGLQPGASSFATFDCREGRLTATVDARGDVAESDETNNSRTAGPFDCRQPDLVVTRLTRDAFTVTNSGDARAPASVVAVTGNGEIPVPAIDAGAAIDGSFSCTEGTLTARADATRIVSESDEANNSRIAGPFVCPKPDLVITAITSTSVTVRNQGDAGSGAFLMSLTGVGNLSVGALAAGTSTTQSFSCTEGSITATADPGDQIEESNEQNNALTVNGLSCPKPDLIVTGLTRSSVTVRNQGNADAGPFKITVTGLQSPLQVGGLAAGTSVTLNFSCREGTFTATADATNQVDESDENNNSATENNPSCID